MCYDIIDEIYDNYYAYLACQRHEKHALLISSPEDVVEERKAKYMVWLESDEDDSSSEDESSSNEY